MNEGAGELKHSRSVKNYSKIIRVPLIPVTFCFCQFALQSLFEIGKSWQETVAYQHDHFINFSFVTINEQI